MVIISVFFFFFLIQPEIFLINTDNNSTCFINSTSFENLGIERFYLLAFLKNDQKIKHWKKIIFQGSQILSSSKIDHQFCIWARTLNMHFILNIIERQSYTGNISYSFNCAYCFLARMIFCNFLKIISTFVWFTKLIKLYRESLWLQNASGIFFFFSFSLVISTGFF
jgi:hypothetical protein